MMLFHRGHLVIPEYRVVKYQVLISRSGTNMYCCIPLHIKITPNSMNIIHRYHRKVLKHWFPKRFQPSQPVHSRLLTPKSVGVMCL